MPKAEAFPKTMQKPSNGIKNPQLKDMPGLKPPSERCMPMAEAFSKTMQKPSNGFKKPQLKEMPRLNTASE